MIYFLVIFFLFIVSFLDLFNSKFEKYRNLVWIICLILFILHDGLRWETGTDWLNYFLYFSDRSQVAYLKFEPLYILLNSIIKSISSNYTIFLIVHSTILYLLIFKSVKDYSKNYIFSIFCYYCLMLPYLGMNRQIIAIAICMYSIRYVVEKDVFKFIITIIIASLFHYSALVFLIVYFVNNQWSNRSYILLLGLSAAISLSGVLNMIPDGFFDLFGDKLAKAGTYLNMYKSSDLIVVVFAILRRILWVVIVLLFADYIKDKNKYYYVLFNTYFIGVCLYIIFNNSAFQFFVGRGILYFGVFEIFIIPYILTIFKRKNASQAIFFVLISLYLVVIMTKGISNYSDLFYPYKGVFINTGIERIMY